MDLMPISNRNIQSKVPLSGESPEVDAIIREAMTHHHNDLISMAEFLYQLANEKLVGCFQLFAFPWKIGEKCYLAILTRSDLTH